MIRLEDIISRENLTAAFNALKPKSARGIDNMGPEDLRQWCKKNPNQITGSIINGSYKPLPVKRAYIPKDDGSLRPIGIGCVKDKLIQNAVAIQLEKLYEPTFSNSSFGFRPNRGAHDAVKLVQEYLNEGYVYAIDLDLKSFFDLVNRNVLKHTLMEKIEDERVLRLIQRILNVKVINDNGEVTRPEKGLVQGGTISPILANIMLDKLDKELERRGLRFARYADDCIILFKSQRAAERSYETLKKFIEKKLKLQINEDKTVIGRVNPKMKFLGFSLYYQPEVKKEFDPLDISEPKGKWKIIVHKKSLFKFRMKARAHLNKKAPHGVEATKESFTKYLMGWAHYFSLGLNNSSMKKVMSWVRAKVRAIYLKQWKRNSTKYKELLKLKTNSKEQCWIVAHSSLGIWAKAHHANFIITKEVIHQRWGWPDLKTIVQFKSWKVLGY